MDAAFVGLLVIILVALAFDYTNGFHDAANAIAVAVSTKALTPRVALALAAVMNLVGALLSTEVAKTVGAGINAIMRKPDKAVLLITHYQRLLDYVQPDFVHVLAAGRIVRSGGPELALELEREGYAQVVA